MTGTWVNVGGIILGALIGVLLGKAIPERIKEAVLRIEGLAIAIIGLNGILGTMLVVNMATGRLDSQGGMLLLVSLVVGNIIGELLDIDGGLNRFGERVEKRLGAEGFAAGFIAASLVFSIGAMAIVGALNDGLRGDSSVLFMKTALDFTTAIILASSLGIGVAFSAVPVFVVQGGVAMLATVIAPFISDSLLEMFCMVGYAIVIVISLNFLLDTKLKTANLLPGLAIPILYYFARFYFG